VEEENVMLTGMGAVVMIALVSSMFQETEPEGPEEPEEPEEPETGEATINSVSWSTVEHTFTDYWTGEALTAFFYKAQVDVTSDAEFSGYMTISCPYTIAPVNLLSSEGYQDLLNEIDELIASYSPGSHAREIWEARKQLALQFPEVDGFYIDHRWTSPENWEDNFREWIRDSINSITWEDVSIPSGRSIETIGFFKTHSVGVGNPVTIKLYNSLGELVATNESSLPGAENAPSVQSLFLPNQVAAGEEFQAHLTVVVPEILPGSQLTYIDISYRQDGPALASAYIANHLNSRWNPEYPYVPMPSADDTYELTIDCKAVRGGRYETPLEPGEYTVEVTTSTWQVGVRGDSLLFYSDEPLSDQFPDVGSFTVV